jgi:hypothetical protein
MGFVAKSAFWLGMVYSAMPFDSGSPIALAPTATAMPPAASSSLESLARRDPELAPEPGWLEVGRRSRRRALRPQLLSPFTRGVELDRCSGPERPGRAVAPALTGEIRPTGRCSTARA